MHCHSLFAPQSTYVLQLTPRICCNSHYTCAATHQRRPVVCRAHHRLVCCNYSTFVLQPNPHMCCNSLTQSTHVLQLISGDPRHAAHTLDLCAVTPLHVCCNTLHICAATYTTHALQLISGDLLRAAHTVFGNMSMWFTNGDLQSTMPCFCCSCHKLQHNATHCTTLQHPATHFAIHSATHSAAH